MSTDTFPRLEVRGLATSFATDGGRIQSVADVSFAIHAGETLALVGESGSGKSVTSLSLMGLHAKTSQAQVGGEAWFVRRDGVRVGDLNRLFQDEGGLDRESVGRIRLRDKHSFVSVPEEKADAVVETLSGKSFAERELKVERAKRS